MKRKSQKYSQLGRGGDWGGSNRKQKSERSGEYKRVKDQVSTKG